METVVITGANRGIGLGLTRRFLEAGKRVIATSRAPGASRELGSLASYGPLSVFPLEVTDADSVAALASRLSGETVDVLVNNAGVMGGARQGIGEMDYEAWLHAFAVNTLAPFRLATALREPLKRSRRPRLVTLSSQMGSFGRRSAGFYAYRSSKAALNKVMQVLAVELEKDGIIVCPVHPGWVRTEMGGSGAELSVEESVTGLFQLIETMTPAHSGRFWTWEGHEHPW
jgi:NAD(P)-dependent dehydrogenase (short-subunit alcohol dehydrogenase family)